MRSLILDTMLFYQTLFVSLADCFLLSGEAITFKATTATILPYCIELMGQMEEQINKRLEKEQIARRNPDIRNADSWISLM